MHIYFGIDIVKSLAASIFRAFAITADLETKDAQVTNTKLPIQFKMAAASFNRKYSKQI